MVRLGALFIVAGFVVVILFVIGLVLAIMARLFRDNVQAAQYRELIRLHELTKTQSPISGWKLTYKDGRKLRSVIVPGETEQDALVAVAKMAIRYDKIQSLIKV